ncbi:MAG: F-box protein [Parachlamydiales bacterium]|nr:F-box protein [Verrucomicrobiota bacterium]MBX3719491.1 F-box protein [Candidatus Acheromyda pituitae]
MSVSNDLNRVPCQENLELALTSQVAQSQGVQEFPITISGVQIPTEIVISIFQMLHPRDIASCMQVCKAFNFFAKNFVLLELIGSNDRASSVVPIIAKYGFQVITDPRNLSVVQKAFQACYFEGQGEGLCYATLTTKLQIAEDRNLVKLFLHYINDSVPGSSSPFPREWPDEAQFLHQHPELNTCCITMVNDIPGAANAIRIWVQAHPVSTWRLPLYQNSGGDNTHLHDKHMCIIAPEVGYFRTDRIDGSNNAFMLVSRNLADALTLDRNHTYYGVSINLSNNQLETLPDEIGAIPHLNQLQIQGNNEHMAKPHTPTVQNGT